LPAQFRNESGTLGQPAPGLTPGPFNAIASIIVIDNLLVTAMATRDMLRHCDFHNVEIASGAEATIEQMKAKGIGLVIAEWNMEPVSGYDLLRQVRADMWLRETTFILTAPKANVANVTAAKRAGADAYVLKPFTPPILRYHIMAAAAARHAIANGREDLS
jgi:two-component system chemotaxis response regulator CheY